MTSLDDHVLEFQYNQCMYLSRDSLGKIAREDKIFYPRVKSQISLSGVQETEHTR